MSLYIRNTLFFPGRSPTTIVIPEESAVPDVWTAANGMRKDVQDNPPEMGWIDVEIFEWDGDFTSASFEAGRRAQKQIPEIERHQNTLHDHIVMIMNDKRILEGALIETINPSPLEKKDIMPVLLKVVKRPEYRGFVLSIHDRNGEPVRLHVDKES